MGKLPLPDAPKILEEKPELLTVWTSVNTFYRAFLESEMGMCQSLHSNEMHSTDSDICFLGIKHYGGPLLLSLKYLNAQLRTWAAEAHQSKPQGSEWLLPAAARMGQAGGWVQEQIPKLTMEPFRNSLELTVYVASRDFEELFPPIYEELRFFQMQRSMPNAVSEHQSTPCSGLRRER